MQNDQGQGVSHAKDSKLPQKVQEKVPASVEHKVPDAAHDTNSNKDTGKVSHATGDSKAFNVYGHDPVGVGIWGIPVDFFILAGACIVLWLLSLLCGHKKELLTVFSVFMTADCGSLAIGRVDKLYQLWGLPVQAGLAVGGIVVPTSIISATIICLDDLVATVTALILAIHVFSGSIGYCVYYNVLISATYYISGVMESRLNITSAEPIREAMVVTRTSLLPLLEELPGIKSVPGAYEMVVYAGQLAYAESYKYVYYVSTALGGVSILAACFLGDISKYMDDHVSAVYWVGQGPNRL
ncbi:hypothetical protein ST47_g1568 [Ascochyta rabiei]|uniref:Transmembrane transport n=1 Tax=Didymella rabiei TaxID=5454 RepID=A0A163KVJ1_DIDRA|nr:hypothetical protein ST47_g1568 [Ascochyta rabiei]